MAIKGNIPSKGGGSGISDETILKLLNELVDDINALGGLITTAEITIPLSGWQSGGSGVRCDAALEGATSGHYPVVAYDPEDMDAAVEAEITSSPEAISGAIRFTARKKPSKDIRAAVALLQSQNE